MITVSGHTSKRGWTERALQRLQERLEPLGVELNREKTKVVNTLREEAFGFLGFDLRRVPKRKENGHFILMTPKKKARLAIKAKIRDIIRCAGATPTEEVIVEINAVLAGWVNYFRVGNSSRAFSEIRDYVEMKVRTLLTRRKRRRKRSVGWRRWSNEYLYDVLGLLWDWEIRPLTSGSNGEGLETGLRTILNGHEGGNPGYSQGHSYGLPRQSFTRQAAFKELKQEIGSQRSQTRNAYAVTNHLQFCIMAATLTWIYAARLKPDPQRRHKVKGRTGFAFSDVRRIVAEAALCENFVGFVPNRSIPRKVLLSTSYCVWSHKNAWIILMKLQLISIVYLK